MVPVKSIMDSPIAEPKKRILFNKELISSKRNSIDVKTLFSRLLELHNELSEIEQDEIDLDSLSKIVTSLSSKNLYNHKDSGVRILTACCLADILRIFAPNAPFTLSQLSAIFKFFVKEFSNLEQRSYPHQQYLNFLLDTIEISQSIALVTDLPNADQLVSSIFELFYNIASIRNDQTLEITMTSILSQLIEESITLPPDVIELIISSFVLSPPTSKDRTNASIPFNQGYAKMTKIICTDNIDIMTRYLNMYFSEILHPDESEDDDVEQEQKNRIKPHELIVEIWKSVPELLINIIGQLELDLSVDNLEIRLSATKSIGEMLGYAPSRSNFVTEHRSTFDSWLGRTKDKDSAVRLVWTECVPDILENRNDICSLVAHGLQERLSDTDERCRSQACELLGGLDIGVVLAYFNESALMLLQERMRDKKNVVRIAAFSAIGKLFDSAYSQIARGEKDYIERFSWMPSKVLDQFYLNDKEVNELIDTCLNTYILPPQDDDKDRARRLLVALKYLDEKSSNAFNAIPRRQHTLAKIILSICNDCYQSNGSNSNGEGKLDIGSAIRWISSTFSDSTKAHNDLQSFFESRNRGLIKNLAKMVNSESDYQSVLKSMKELQKSLPSSQIATFEILMFRSGYIIINKSTITPILDILNDNLDPLHEVAHIALKIFAEVQPNIMKSTFHTFAEIIQGNTPGFEGSVDTLKAAYMIGSKYPSSIPQTPQFPKSLSTFALNGNPEEASEAVRLLSLLKDQKDVLTDIIEKSTLELDISDPNITTRLAVLAELYSTVPDMIEILSPKITTFVIHEVLLTNHSENVDEEVDWVERKDLDKFGQAKLLALKILVNKIRVAEHSDNVAELSKPVFKLLISLIGNGGEIVPERNTPKSHQAQLRLNAGLELLKLAQLPTFDRFIRPSDVNRLVLLVQDACLQVRKEFIKFLTHSLGSSVISIRFLPLVFIMAFEPSKELREYIETWIRARSSRSQSATPQDTSMEKSFARLLHMIAHHRDLFAHYDSDSIETEANQEETTISDLATASVYILYYLNAVSTHENLTLILNVAQVIKQYEDKVDEAKTETLHMLSDLSQYWINQIKETKKWGMTSWPGQIVLSPDIFRPLTVDNINVPDLKSSLDEKLLSRVDVTLKAKLSEYNITFSESLNAKRSAAGQVDTASHKRKISKSKPSKEKAILKEKAIPNEEPTEQKRLDNRSTRASRRLSRQNMLNDEK